MSAELPVVVGPRLVLLHVRLALLRYRAEHERLGRADELPPGLFELEAGLAESTGARGATGCVGLRQGASGSGERVPAGAALVLGGVVPEFVTHDEAAELLHCKRRKVQRLVEAGVLPEPMRHGRRAMHRRADVLALIDRGES